MYLYTYSVFMIFFGQATYGASIYTLDEAMRALSERRTETKLGLNLPILTGAL
jgi:hypothetical protein